MSVRDGKAQGVALAGVAAIGLLVGGMVFVRSAGTSAGVPVKAVLNGSAPRWADGYNHFILTMSGPVPLIGDGSVAKRSAAPTPAGARPEAGRAAQVPSRLGAASASVRLSAANAPGVVTRGAHSAQGSAGPKVALVHKVLAVRRAPPSRTASLGRLCRPTRQIPSFGAPASRSRSWRATSPVTPRAPRSNATAKATFAQCCHRARILPRRRRRGAREVAVQWSASPLEVATPRLSCPASDRQRRHMAGTRRAGARTVRRSRTRF